MTDWLDTFLAICAHRGDQLYQSQPAWMWSRDGSRVLWANPAGAGLLGVSDLDGLSAISLPLSSNLRRDIANVARLLRHGPTLARLRLFKGGQSLPLACRCERFRLPDGRASILVVAVDAAGLRMPDDSEMAAFMSIQGRRTFVLDRDSRVLADNGGTGQPGDIPGLTMADGVQSGELTIADTSVRFRAVPAAGAGGPRQLLWADRLSDAAAARAPDDAAVPAGRPETDAEDGGIVDPVTASVTSGPENAEERLPDQAGYPDRLPPEDIQQNSLSQQARMLRSALRGSSGSDEKAVSEAWPDALDALPKKPVRFLWQTDADDRFLFVSPGLEQLVGRCSQIVGERWEDIAERMRLDPVGRVGQALAARDTWSGFTAWWPTEDRSARIPAELTALPVFAVDQSFQGYRGFGVLKPAEALSALAFDRRFPGDPLQEPPDSLPSGSEGAAGPGPQRPANVVPIRDDLKRLPDFARLSPQERSAFDEIALALKTHDEIAHLYARSLPASLSDPASDPASGPSDASVSGGGDSQSADEGIESTPKKQTAEGEYSTDAEDPAFLASLPDDDDDYPPDIDEMPSGELDDAAGTPAEAVVPPPEEAETDAASDGVEQAQAAELVAPAPANDDRATSAATSGGGPRQSVAELEIALDIAADGIVIIDGSAAIRSLGAGAGALFGTSQEAAVGKPFIEFLDEDCRQSALDYLDGLRDHGAAGVLGPGREVSVLSGTATIPLFMTIGPAGSDDEDHYCVVLRDISRWKRTEADLIAARDAAEQASEQKSEFLARVSHEIRTPLNAIIGFAEVMIEERFGPVENERYREYLRDIRTSGEHVVSLVNDLLDISKIEAGKLDLTFSAVPLNELARECVTLMQPQANRAKVIVRSSLAGDLPSIVADPRTMRQVVLNLLSNSIKFTGSGGQVIVSTTLTDTGEAVLRIRDTGAGMSEEDLARALEPFRQLSTSRIGDENGTGLGLPLTKALVEANRAAFTISSAKGEGTIVQVTFPATRVLSE